jgi:AcrR family transcriptional regulator
VVETPPRRADARRIEDRILRCAIGVLRADSGASMARVAAAVGVHRATLYRHFPTREALIARLAAGATAKGREIVAEIASERPSLSGVKRLSDAITEFGDRYRFLIGTAPVLNTGADPIGLAALMSGWQKAGILRADLPPEWLAASFTSLAIALRENSGPVSVDLASANHSELLFETFVYGTAAS